MSPRLMGLQAASALHLEGVSLSELLSASQPNFLVERQTIRSVIVPIKPLYTPSFHFIVHLLPNLIVIYPYILSLILISTLHLYRHPLGLLAKEDARV